MTQLIRLKEQDDDLGATSTDGPYPNPLENFQPFLEVRYYTTLHLGLQNEC
jgi:hypothetical protein